MMQKPYMGSLRKRELRATDPCLTNRYLYPVIYSQNYNSREADEAFHPLRIPQHFMIST